MSENRPWYLEPETFVAVAALIVSFSALGVGVYEDRGQHGARPGRGGWSRHDSGQLIDA